MFEIIIDKNFPEELNVDENKSDIKNLKLNVENTYFPIGTIPFVKRIRNNYKTFSYETINIDTYVSQSVFLTEQMFNFEYIIMPYFKVNINIFNIFNDDKIFIRPNSSWKPFAGRMYTKETFISDYKCEYVQPDELCIISNYKNIDYEYRFFIINDKIIDCCQSHEKSNVSIQQYVPDNIINYVNKIIKRGMLEPFGKGFVLDVVQSGDLISIMELNSLHSSGFCCCDYNKIINEIKQGYDKCI